MQCYTVQGFYIYLYLVSSIFLFYVYAYLLRRQALFKPGFKRAFSSIRLRSAFRRTLSSGSYLSRSESSFSGGAPSTGEGGTVKHKRRRVSYNQKPNNHTGSFYLRVGAIGEALYIALLLTRAKILRNLFYYEPVQRLLPVP